MKSRSAAAVQTFASSYAASRAPASHRPVRARPRPLFAVGDVQAAAGLMLFRRSQASVEVLLAHPGGPLFASKDIWALPKGDVREDEGPLAAARREFERSLGAKAPSGALHDLGFVNTRSGLVIYAWGIEGSFDPHDVRSTMTELEWPPVSGNTQRFPEVDRVAWFDLDLAHHRISPSQRPFLQRLGTALR